MHADFNILILGETGVGKSTWINAFINYLTFESFDEALDAESLKRAIPCSFSTIVNRFGQFVKEDIIVGSGDKNINSETATQSTSVYAIKIGTITIRLIDTPGGLDTRGLEQDNENMTELLRVLGNYRSLHGIVILLKSNLSRLTLGFTFYIKQLLTHLHRDAANNIVFGFTNTRMANYTPRDTFKPLETLLKECDNLRRRLPSRKVFCFDLAHHNVYCFDSESFRFLAARKNGIEIDHSEYLEDCRLSWQHSTEDCRRLLKHFWTQKPYMLQSTLELNRIRHIIMRLPEPERQMRQKIQQADTGLWKPLRKPLPEELLCAQIQNAVLCLHDYLRNNAVIPSNDATLAFIDSQIQGEKERARVGQSENRLERLQKYRAQYEQSLDYYKVPLAKTNFIKR